MPELPEVESLRRALSPQLLGHRFEGVTVRQPQLRQSVPVDELHSQGTRTDIIALRRRGKYLLIDFANAHTLMVHLGMSGRLLWCTADAPARTHDHIVWTLSTHHELRFNDSRRFGMIDIFPTACAEQHPRLKHLGIEPLEASFTDTALHALAHRSKRPIKSFLMDAGQVVGVGNIYACESLFRAGIHPQAPCCTVNPEDWTRLCNAIRHTLQAAIDVGGTTFRDFQSSTGAPGYFHTSLYVYGRDQENCKKCATPIEKVRQQGRSTFFCPQCQLDPIDKRKYDNVIR